MTKVAITISVLVALATFLASFNNYGIKSERDENYIRQNSAGLTRNIVGGGPAAGK